MRFLVEWEWTEARSDEEQVKVLALFAAWKPPVELSEWSGFADGSGGFAVADATDANELTRITAPWTPWFRFSVRPVQPIQETATATQEAIQFRQSVT